MPIKDAVILMCDEDGCEQFVVTWAERMNLDLLAGMFTEICQPKGWKVSQNPEDWSWRAWCPDHSEGKA